ncbi:MAG: hypothetical protein VKN33_10180 [Candidatus Sericytochromatia bacterium]|nr:hypothetical protein [Candidatus Sericytochromatia bacterium]
MKIAPACFSKAITLLLCLLSSNFFAYDAWAQEEPTSDEKLPAQLPTVTIQGQDLSERATPASGRVTPQRGGWDTNVRLPEPAARRATSEENRSLMVGVTPTTVEPPQALPETRMPYTAVTGGWGPLLQYRAGLYDARWWGPVLGLTELEGLSGWGWSGWQARQWLDWPGVLKAGGSGEGFLWQTGDKSGGQSAYSVALNSSFSPQWGATLHYDRGLAQANGEPDLYAQNTALNLNWAPPSLRSQHQLKVEMIAQQRIWGIQNGPEGYARLSDFWSLSEQVELEGSIGGGYWGREPIFDPAFTFHYRPSILTHLFAGLRAKSELPNFQTLYLRRPATAAALDLQSERIQGLAQAGGSHRLTERIWLRSTLELRRSLRYVYWNDSDSDGLWKPVNADIEQWSPSADAQIQIQWLPNFQQNLQAAVLTTWPLGYSELRGGTTIEGTLPGPDAAITCAGSLHARRAALVSAQVPGGGVANGIFAEADLRYPVSPDVQMSLRIADVPLILEQANAKNYFAPVPLLTLNLQYQF